MMYPSCSVDPNNNTATRKIRLRLFDCHTHLDKYPEPELEGILYRAKEVGVGGAIVAGTTIESSLNSVRLAENNPNLFAAIGIHPMDITLPFDYTEHEVLAELALNDRVLAISEVGLDGLKGAPDIALQEEVFRANIQLAKNNNLPIIYHSRETYPRILDILASEGAQTVGGAAHYFQGDLKTAKRCIDLGFFISLARPLLRIPDLQEIARKVPIEYIVLETDSYPQHFKKNRQNWTEPRHLTEVALALSEIRNITLEQVIQQTSCNILNMLGSRSESIKGALEDTFTM